MNEEREKVTAQFDALCEGIRQRLGADRVTLRLDLPEHGIGVNLPCGESAAARAPSLRAEAGLDQWALDTVRWLVNETRPLVQDDFTGAPHPPEALLSIYKVSAQVLCPVFSTFPTVIGWLSVHQVCERHWSAEDLSHCARTVAQVDAVLAGRSHTE